MPSLREATALATSDLNAEPLPRTPPRSILPSSTSISKPLAHSAPSSPNTPSPFRSAISPAVSPLNFLALGSPSKRPAGQADHASPSRSGAGSSGRRYREHSAPIRSLLKQTSRRLLAIKPGAGQWRQSQIENASKDQENTDTGAGVEGESRRRLKGSMSSLKDLLGVGGAKSRPGSRDRAEGRTLPAGETEEGQAVPPLDHTSVEGQFDDAASIPSPGHVIPGDTATSSTAIRPNGPPVAAPFMTHTATSTRPSASKLGRVAFSYPLKPQPTDSPFHEPPIDDSTVFTLPATATIDAQRHHLAIAGKAGFIPASLASIRNEPFAKAAREFSGMSTNLIMPASDAYSTPDTSIAIDGHGLGHGHCRGDTPRPTPDPEDGQERAGGLMQRIRLAIEYQQSPPSSLSASQVSPSMNGSQARRVVSRGSDVSICESVRGADEAPNGIFSPNIPQDPIARRIEGTLSKSIARELTGGAEKARDGVAELASLFIASTEFTSAQGEAKPPHPSASAKQSREKGLVPFAKSASTFKLPTRHTFVAKEDPQSHLQRAAFARETGARPTVSQPATLAPLAHKVSKGKYARTHFRVTPIPAPVPPSLLARSRSDAGSTRNSRDTIPTSTVSASAVDTDSTVTLTGKGQAQSAPGSTFVQSANKAAAAQSKQEVPDLSHEEVEALIRAEIRAEDQGDQDAGN